MMGLFDRFKKTSSPSVPKEIAINAQADTIYAPVSGKIEPMESLSDPVFCSGAMGRALGIWPDEGTVYAPTSGVITALMPHAFAIRGDDGNDVLVHVGVDTVDMRGDGFAVHAAKGDHVACGQPIVSFDRKKVQKAGLSDIVMTVAASTVAIEGAGGTVIPSTAGRVAVGDVLFSITR